MSTAAAGAYLKALREARGITRVEVARLVDTSPSQVERIETGKQETRGSVLLAFVRAVGGNADQLAELLLDEQATEEVGKEVASDWLLEDAARQTSNEEPQSLGVSPEVRQAEVRRSLQRHGKTKILGPMLEETERELLRLDAVLDPYRPGQHIYEGTREPNGDCKVTVDGQPLAAALGWQVSFEWGYRGSGPSSLANAILSYEYGLDIPSHYKARFLFDVTSRLPHELGGLEWVLDSEEIALWFKIVRLVERASQHI